MNLNEILGKTKIVPVAVLNDPDDAQKTAEILLNNSIPILEITLRTDKAFQCIYEVSRNFPEMLVGCGSVLSKDALKRACDSGSKFGVAPCLDVEVVDYAMSLDLNFIPGIATPSELNAALKLGLNIIKIFPASQLGGVNFIQAIISPFKMMDFHLVPTGGISVNNISDYIRTDRVMACGLSYVVDSKIITKGDFAEIEDRIKRVKENVFAS